MKYVINRSGQRSIHLISPPRAGPPRARPVIKESIIMILKKNGRYNRDIDTCRCTMYGQYKDYHIFIEAEYYVPEQKELWRIVSVSNKNLNQEMFGLVTIDNSDLLSVVQAEREKIAQRAEFLYDRWVAKELAKWGNNNGAIN